jgi:putative transcriptional regulator
MGVIINRPLEVRVNDFSEQIAAAAGVDQPLHQGGPCEGPLTALHMNFAVSGDAVAGDIRFSMEKDAIEWLMENNKGPIKFFAGYSGWSRGQLDSEIDEGAWVMTEASQEHVFERQGDWSKLSTWLALGKSMDIDRIPDDPSVN